MRGVRTQGGRNSGHQLLGGIIAGALALALLYAFAVRVLPEIAGAFLAAQPVDMTADDVVVDQREIDLGRVPLDKVVPVSVQLTNRSQRTIQLSQATAEALEGC